MRILSLWQPYASLIALGLKKHETRSWGTDYRGKLLIHATKTQPICVTSVLESVALHMTLEQIDRVKSSLPLPQGCVVATADLTDCRMMNSKYSTISEQVYAYINEQSPLDLAVGDWQPGRYAWQLDDIIALPNPITWTGAQGLRNVAPKLVDLVNQQLAIEK